MGWTGNDTPFTVQHRRNHMGWRDGSDVVPNGSRDSDPLERRMAAGRSPPILGTTSEPSRQHMKNLRRPTTPLAVAVPNRGYNFPARWSSTIRSG